ncbi:hypothetical protein HDV00_012725 [Rhizophlyctis rosea]|nr:hypothetical protein HDV00_012725 [Rhizophlyctis rosea]
MPETPNEQVEDSKTHTSEQSTLSESAIPPALGTSLQRGDEADGVSAAPAAEALIIAPSSADQQSQEHHSHGETPNVLTEELVSPNETAAVQQLLDVNAQMMVAMPDSDSGPSEESTRPQVQFYANEPHVEELHPAEKPPSASVQNNGHLTSVDAMEAPTQQEENTPDLPASSASGLEEGPISLSLGLPTLDLKLECAEKAQQSIAEEQPPKDAPASNMVLVHTPEPAVNDSHKPSTNVEDQQQQCNSPILVPHIIPATSSHPENSPDQGQFQLPSSNDVHNQSATENPAPSESSSRVHDQGELGPASPSGVSSKDQQQQDLNVSPSHTAEPEPIESHQDVEHANRPSAFPQNEVVSNRQEEIQVSEDEGQSGSEEREHLELPATDHSPTVVEHVAQKEEVSPRQEEPVSDMEHLPPSQDKEAEQGCPPPADGRTASQDGQVGVGEQLPAVDVSTSCIEQAGQNEHRQAEDVLPGREETYEEGTQLPTNDVSPSPAEQKEHRPVEDVSSTRDEQREHLQLDKPSPSPKEQPKNAEHLPTDGTSPTQDDQVKNGPHPRTVAVSPPLDDKLRTSANFQADEASLELPTPKKQVSEHVADVGEKAAQVQQQRSVSPQSKAESVKRLPSGLVNVFRTTPEGIKKDTNVRKVGKVGRYPSAEVPSGVFKGLTKGTELRQDLARSAPSHSGSTASAATISPRTTSAPPTKPSSTSSTPKPRGESSAAGARSTISIKPRQPTTFRGQPLPRGRDDNSVRLPPGICLPFFEKGFCPFERCKCTHIGGHRDEEVTKTVCVRSRMLLSTDEIKEAYQKIAPVADVRIVQYPTQFHILLAFVDFENEYAASLALSMPVKIRTECVSCKPSDTPSWSTTTTTSSANQRSNLSTSSSLSATAPRVEAPQAKVITAPPKLNAPKQVLWPRRDGTEVVPLDQLNKTKSKTPPTVTTEDVSTKAIAPSTADGIEKNGPEVDSVKEKDKVATEDASPKVISTPTPGEIEKSEQEVDSAKEKDQAKMESRNWVAAEKTEREAKSMYEMNKGKVEGGHGESMGDESVATKLPPAAEKTEVAGRKAEPVDQMKEVEVESGRVVGTEGESIIAAQPSAFEKTGKTEKEPKSREVVATDYKSTHAPTPSAVEMPKKLPQPSSSSTHPANSAAKPKFNWPRPQGTKIIPFGERTKPQPVAQTPVTAVAPPISSNTSSSSPASATKATVEDSPGLVETPSGSADEDQKTGTPASSKADSSKDISAGEAEQDMERQSGSDAGVAAGAAVVTGDETMEEKLKQGEGMQDMSPKGQDQPKSGSQSSNDMVDARQEGVLDGLTPAVISAAVAAAGNEETMEEEESKEKEAEDAVSRDVDGGSNNVSFKIDSPAGSSAHGSTSSFLAAVLSTADCLAGLLPHDASVPNTPSPAQRFLALSPRPHTPSPPSKQPSHGSSPSYEADVSSPATVDSAVGTHSTNTPTAETCSTNTPDRPVANDEAAAVQAVLGSREVSPTAGQLEVDRKSMPASPLSASHQVDHESVSSLLQGVEARLTKMITDQFAKMGDAVSALKAQSDANAQMTKKRLDYFEDRLGELRPEILTNAPPHLTEPRPSPSETRQKAFLETKFTDLKSGQARLSNDAANILSTLDEHAEDWKELFGEMEKGISRVDKRVKEQQAEEKERQERLEIKLDVISNLIVEQCGGRDDDDDDGPGSLWIKFPEPVGYRFVVADKDTSIQDAIKEHIRAHDSEFKQLIIWAMQRTRPDDTRQTTEECVEQIQLPGIGKKKVRRRRGETLADVVSDNYDLDRDVIHNQLLRDALRDSYEAVAASGDGPATLL